MDNDVIADPHPVPNDGELFDFNIRSDVLSLDYGEFAYH
jgi:hypothetical protein